MNNRDHYLLTIIRASIWGTPIDKVTKDEFEEMQRHAIVALPVQVLSSVSMSPELLQEWKEQIFQQIAYYNKYKYAESKIPISCPYVILKGSSAAQYYPKPCLRTMGDIDIITKSEDYIYACNELLQNGYEEVCNSISDQERHREFKKYDVLVEVHSSFASLNDAEKAIAFDNIIRSNITDAHVLPDLINGLVLIEHVNQHLETGIGLRQIIDWMMFVEKCLPDNKWETFRQLLCDTGLELLCIVLTRMCEIYLGLSEHNWSANADEKLCSHLLEYVLNCGNFGRKKTTEMNKAYNRTSLIRHPIYMIKELQKRGNQEWDSAKNRIPRCLAWLWKGIQVVKESIGMREEFIKAKEMKKLFYALGVKRNNIDKWK